MKTRWDENGEQKENTSPLSLIITAFGRVEDVRKTVTPQLRTDKGDSALVLVDLGCGQNRMGATALAQVYKQLGDKPADVDSPELLKGFFNAMQILVRDEKLLAYHDRGDGGLYVTLAEMAFAGHVGVEVDINTLSAEGECSDELAALFNEELGAVVQVRTEDLDSVLSTLSAHGLEACSHVIGTLTEDDAVRIWNGDALVLDQNRTELRTIWLKPLTKCRRCAITHAVLSKSLMPRKM